MCKLCLIVKQIIVSKTLLTDKLLEIKNDKMGYCAYSRRIGYMFVGYMFERK